MFNVLLTKPETGEVYSYRLDREENLVHLLASIGRDAANPELSLTWWDASCLVADIRRQIKLRKIIDKQESQVTSEQVAQFAAEIRKRWADEACS